MEKLLDSFIKLLTFGWSQRRKKDRKLLDQLLEGLPPSSGAIRFLKEHDLGDSFQYEIISPLYQVLEDWKRVDSKFLNKNIEKKKNSFLEKLRDFRELFGQRSGSEGSGFISIGLRDWEDRPDMLKYRDELNKIATEAHNLYFEFYEYANRKLPV